MDRHRLRRRRWLRKSLPPVTDSAQTKSQANRTSSQFWFLSVCCCSGRSPYNKNAERASRGKTRAEKTPYTYERVGSPYMGPNAGQSVPLNSYGGAQPTGSAYEPFRSHA
jgi:hypothetical protein